MNILFLTLSDFSSLEEKGIYPDLMRKFVENNHNLYIISPIERIKKKPTHLITKEKYKILKLQIGNTKKANMIEKGISTLTLETNLMQTIKKKFKDVKFDLVLYSTPPITFYKAVNYVKTRDNAKTYLLLKDIFPQNAVDLGILNKKGFKSIIYEYFRYKEKKLYAISDYIGCMSEENKNYLLKNNPSIPSKSVEVCPNSIEPLEINLSLKDKKTIKEKYNIPLNRSVFIYGGNLGKPQGVDFLIECIRANEKNDQAYFLIVGSGTEFEKLNLFFETERPKNSQLLNQLPKKDYELIANSCDVGLIFLDHKFTIPNFPSRLLSYMQASMPVLAATDPNTDIGNVIEKGNFGYWCESKDIRAFNSLVKKLCDKDLCKELGINARKYLEENYTTNHSYEIIMDHFN